MKELDVGPNQNVGGAWMGEGCEGGGEVRWSGCAGVEFLAKHRMNLTPLSSPGSVAGMKTLVLFAAASSHTTTSARRNFSDFFSPSYSSLIVVHFPRQAPKKSLP